ncbi:MAG: decarboxylating 6-phosphogluconate dehydrogenase [Betaproteobacteria bacterium]|nr:decarboxylating 6-phosphogluconate dehydrogenase [Betaproteobacteria bacterium]
MNFGMIGLGRMGANIVRRLSQHEIASVIYDKSPDAIEQLAAEGSTVAANLADFVSKLAIPRTIWIMVPSSEVDSTINVLSNFLSSGDTIIDGGNSYYKNDLVNAKKLAALGINFVDIGTSGGIHGLTRGYSLMVGGEKEVINKLEPILKALSPGVDTVSRTPGRTGDPSQSEHGYLHCGPHGAGHFVKMVHNGIEYGMMAAIAEGLAIFEAAGEMTHPYDFDISEIIQVWRRGSVIESWLLDLTAQSLQESPQLIEYSSSVSDSGEGRWAVEAAIESGIPAYVLSAALYSRFASRDNDEFSNRILSAMRSKFGGHTP